MPQSIQTADLIRESWSAPIVVAHRGGAAYKPENTLEAYSHAMSLGSRIGETDIHLSQDGEMVVMHDPTLNRTTDLEGRVDATLWSVMKEAGIPHLSDLTALTKSRMNLVIEIKDGAGIEEKLVRHLKDQKLTKETIVFSFAGERVQKVKELDGKQYTVWLSAAKPNLETFWTVVDSYKVDAFGVQYRNCSPELVAAAKSRKIPIFVWTVPPGVEVDRLNKLGVNFIITDHPKDVQDQLSQK